MRRDGNLNVGDDSVVMGRVSGNVGDRSVVIGATDDKGNTILNKPMAVGYNAHAVAGSIAIGSMAHAGHRARTSYLQKQESFMRRLMKVGIIAILISSIKKLLS